MMFVSFLTLDANSHVIVPAALLTIIHDRAKGSAVAIINGKEYPIECSGSVLYGTLEQCVAAYNEFTADMDHEPFLHIINDGKYAKTPRKHSTPTKAS